MEKVKCEKIISSLVQTLTTDWLHIASYRNQCQILANFVGLKLHNDDFNLSKVINGDKSSVFEQC